MNTKKKLVGVLMVLILIISGCSAPQNEQPTNTSNPEQQTNKTQTISQEDAIAIALKQANYAKEDVNALRTKSDTEDGIPVYEVEFIANGKEYKYEIKQSDGAILKEESELQQPTSNTTHQQGNESSISLEQAKQMVLDKVPGATNNDLSIHSDYEDGVPTYEGSLYYQGMEYEFEINANDGTMMKWSEEVWD